MTPESQRPVGEKRTYGRRAILKGFAAAPLALPLILEACSQGTETGKPIQQTTLTVEPRETLNPDIHFVTSTPNNPIFTGTPFPFPTGTDPESDKQGTPNATETPFQREFDPELAAKPLEPALTSESTITLENKSDWENYFEPVTQEIAKKLEEMGNSLDPLPKEQVDFPQAFSYLFPFDPRGERGNVYGNYYSKILDDTATGEFYVHNVEIIGFGFTRDSGTVDFLRAPLSGEYKIENY